ncbi:AAA family ATPase [Niallia taxi]|uniref:AAA family ATPase n=1 Tax=Niallia taxi TaxID=2499688 RepID=UPI0015F67B07|nr:AAA family ATPase [Niallia taxi]
MFKKAVRIGQPQIEAIKSKIPQVVGKVEQSKSEGVARIYMKVKKDGATALSAAPIFIDVKEGTVAHYCEKTKAKAVCTHVTVAGAIAHQLGVNIEMTYMPSSIKDLKEYMALDDFEDISEEFNVQPPLGTGVTTPAASSKPAPAPVKPTAPVSADEQEVWEDVETYLIDEGCEQPIIDWVQSYRNTVDVTMTHAAAPVKRPKTLYRGAYLKRALMHIKNGKDLILVGKKGTGKDTAIASLSYVLKLPLYLQAGSGGETKESIVGDRTLKNGEVQFELSPYALSVQNGGLVHYSEVNMMDGETTAIFHPVLDDNRVLPTPVGPIDRHPNNIFIGSMNIGDGYAGIKEVNEAFGDRVAILTLPYTQDFEIMLRDKTGLSDYRTVKTLNDINQAIKTLISTTNQGMASETMRGFIDVASFLVDNGISEENLTIALEDYIINKTMDLDERMAVRQAIRENGWTDLPVSDEEEAYLPA